MAEPREVIVMRWRCAFCSRGYSRKKLAAEHMDSCRESPENAARIARLNAEAEADGYDADPWGTPPYPYGPGPEF